MRSIAVKKRYNVLNRVLHIPEGVTKIDYSAFCNCANLKSVTIPSSMTWIDDVYGEESDCRSITNITYNGTISQWKTIEKQSLRDVTVNCIDGTISKKADLDGNGKIDTSDIFDAMVYVAYRGVGLDGGSRTSRLLLLISTATERWIPRISTICFTMLRSKAQAKTRPGRMSFIDELSKTEPESRCV